MFKKHLWKTLIIISIVVTSLVAFFSFKSQKLAGIDIPLTEVSEIKTLTGQGRLFLFKDKTTNKEFEVSVSITDYDSFFKTRIKPIYPNAYFVGASFKPIYSISIPVLGDYEYFIEDRTMASGTSPILIKLPNLPAKEVPGDYSIDNKLTPTEVNELTK